MCGAVQSQSHPSFEDPFVTWRRLMCRLLIVAHFAAGRNQGQRRRANTVESRGSSSGIGSGSEGGWEGVRPLLSAEGSRHPGPRAGSAPCTRWSLSRRGTEERERRGKRVGPVVVFLGGIRTGGDDSVSVSLLDSPFSHCFSRTASVVRALPCCVIMCHVRM